MAKEPLVAAVLKFKLNIIIFAIVSLTSFLINLYFFKTCQKEATAQLAKWKKAIVQAKRRKKGMVRSEAVA